MSLKARNFESLLEAVLAWRQPPFSSTTRRQRPSRSSALSALAMKADEKRSQSAGCNAYIVKPLRYREPLAVMDGLLVEPQQADKQATPPSLSTT